MAEAATATAGRIRWIDLSTKDAAGARDFYGSLFGWDIEVNTDPQYGGYALARIGGQDVAGIGPAMSPDQPSAWSVYVGSSDLEGLADAVASAGGSVVMAPFAVGDQGRMAVFQDPGGAFISAWQTTGMGGFQTEGANAFGWADLNARDYERFVPFYTRVFGWEAKSVGTPQQPYTEFAIDGGPSFAGATEISPMASADMPNYWMTYFSVEDVDSAYKQALALGGHEMLSPIDFPGGRLAIISDPQGAIFGIMTYHAS
jgi:predicted enzyme related to lactoylglutathione lyase